MPDYRLAVRRAALRYGLDPNILERQIGAESNFNPNARSPKGAQGIAQFIPSTAKAYGVNLNDGKAKDDIDGAARMMRDLMRQFGSYRKAIAAYNAGPGAAQQYGGVPPFAETQAYVKKILGGSDPAPQGASTRGGAASRSSTVPGVDRSKERQALLLGYLENRHDPNALLSLGTGLKGAQDTPASKINVGSKSSPANDTVAALAQEATRISKAKVPYLWGGGHGAKQAAGSKVTPLDCSGAVSRVLGINPKVSGEFAKWGGAGRGKRVTIYANSGHVLMEIDGHFFGTSSANPGGGAGWIPRKQISSAYLSKFTARHPQGM